MALDYHTLEVAKIEQTAEDAVCVTFLVPDGLKSEFQFKPGQHLTFNHEINGEKLRRFYSICSSPGRDELRIGARAITDGRFSGYLNSEIKVGDNLDVLIPRGRFFLKGDAKGKHILAFASGSGITPIYSILSHHLAQDAAATATLIFGNRNTKTIMLRNDINDLKDLYLNRFQVVHILSREQQDIDILNGRIDDKSIAALARDNLITPKNAAQVFICGPNDMIENVTNAMNNAGVEADHLTVEQFTAVKNAKPASKEVQENIKSGTMVSYILDGAEKNFQLNDPDNTVLDAAQNAGHELPFSCAGGMCATCRCKLVEGEVEMATNYALEPWELKAGYVLACQSRPKTKSIRLDFDAS